MADTIIQKKACLRCGRVKSLANFSKQRRGLMGVRSRCKPCERQLRVATYPRTKLCVGCGIARPFRDFFFTTHSRLRPERVTTCKPCLQLKRFWSYVLKTETCWTWTGSRNDDGYGMFDHGSAHQFSWKLRNGPIPDGLCVLHHCDNPPCVRPDHLYCGTKRDNYDDMVKRNRLSTAYATRGTRAVLTPEIVRQARTMYATGQFTHKQIHAAFGIACGIATIQQAISGITWKHL